MTRIATSRRKFLISSADIAASASLPTVTLASTAMPAGASTPSNPSKGLTMSTISTKDGTQIYYND